MTGVAIAVEVDDEDVQAGLRRLIEAAVDVTPALEAIGEHLLVSHESYFEDEQSPDGEPWAPLSPRYAARKARSHPEAGLLVRDDLLRGLLRYQVDDDELQFGTDRVYGAVHQFGWEERNIPARPYLGIADDDRDPILDILRDHLEDAIGNSA